MVNWDFTRRALMAGVFLASVAGCAGGGGGVPVGPRAVGSATQPTKHTFHYVDKVQPFKVPAGVTSVKIIARAASGGGSNEVSGGRGGRAFAIVPVHPGEMLYVYVGGTGALNAGGFNGGANGGKLFSESGYGGGGASDVRAGDRKLAHRIVIAGGGGGEGGDNRDGYGVGGRGGGLIGGDGHSGSTSSYLGGGGGSGGTQQAGGQGGTSGSGTFGSGNPGKHGSLGRGGAGGAGKHSVGGGGGGGGGYYGGGGGGSASYGTSEYGGGGGGGGGSSYVEPGATRSKLWQGWKNAVGNGLVVISW